jgi:hypothetical protein
LLNQHVADCTSKCDQMIPQSAVLPYLAGSYLNTALARHYLNTLANLIW